MENNLENATTFSDEKLKKLMDIKAKLRDISITFACVENLSIDIHEMKNLHQELSNSLPMLQREFDSVSPNIF